MRRRTVPSADSTKVLDFWISPLLLHFCLIKLSFVTFLLLGLLKLEEEFLLFFGLCNAVLLFLNGEFVALHFQ